MYVTNEVIAPVVYVYEVEIWVIFLTYKVSQSNISIVIFVMKFDYTTLFKFSLPLGKH